MKQKHLSSKDFNLMVDALRAKNNPEVRPVKGQLNGRATWRVY